MASLPLSDVNIVAVIVTTIVGMIIGFTWYSPKMFGTAWMQLSGKTEADMQNCDMKKGMTTEFIGTFIFTYVLATVLQMAGPGSLGDGMALGILLWLGFIVPMLLSGIAWDNKHPKLQAINGGGCLVSIVVAVLILMSWPV